MQTDTIITDRTRANYVAGWRHFTEWCAANGHDPLDTDGEAVAAWMLAMYAAGRKPGTVKLWRVGVAHRYSTDPVLLSRPDPTKTEPVRAAARQITRAAARAGRTVESATAMTPDVLERVLAVSQLRRACESDEQADRRHAETSAVLPMMCDGLLRADETVRARWEDLVTTPHPRSGHFKLRIPRSKTDQNGNGEHAFVSRPTYEALQRWRSHPAADPVYICTTRNPNALGQRIRRLGEVAGIKLSGHSPRRGGATDLANNGATERQLKARGRWRRSDTVTRYVDEADAAGEDPRYDNGHDEPDTDPAAAGWRWPGVELSHDIDVRYPQAVARLEMAAALDADRDHPEVSEARTDVLRLWPFEMPPADCDRPGCCGLVLTANPRPGERWCSIRCQTIARRERRNAQRRQKAKA